MRLKEELEDLVDRRRLLTPCALCLRQHLGSTTGGLASTLGSGVVPFSPADLLKSLDLEGAPDMSCSDSSTQLALAHLMRVCEGAGRDTLPGQPCYSSSRASPHQSEDRGPHKLIFLISVVHYL